MSVKRTNDGTVTVNDRLEIKHTVLFTGSGPSIIFEDVEDRDMVFVSTKQEAEEVMNACRLFLEHLDSWDWVEKDKPDDDTE